MAERAIIDWAAWADSAPGRYVLTWEQAQLDGVVSDVFGYHALQLGLPQIDALRENRMPSRALLLDPASAASAPYAAPRGTAALPVDEMRGAISLDRHRPRAAPHDVREPRGAGCHAHPVRGTVWCDFLDLPFDAQSVDLLALPHTLEFSRNPHRLLREAERVLMPEGRLVITGFNSLSLWGARQSFIKLGGRPCVPSAHDLIAFPRLKDWIKLLDFEIDRGRFGCYRPPLGSDRWLTRYAFMEAAGDRWWPIFGAAYMITAIKRVRGMRLIGPKRVRKPVRLTALAPVAAPQAHAGARSGANHAAMTPTPTPTPRTVRAAPASDAPRPARATVSVDGSGA